MIRILILYYSVHGGTAKLAQQIARGAESVNGVEGVEGVEVLLRTVPRLKPATEPAEAAVPDHGAPYVSKNELRDCHALALGSPTRFGTMAAPLKGFLEQTSDLWISGALVNKPAMVFSCTSSMHGGQEATLLSMMLPLLHHGMLLMGLPYTEPEVMRTQSGGTPYGPSHVSGAASNTPLSGEEEKLARAAGKRLAEMALRLQKSV